MDRIVTMCTWLIDTGTEQGLQHCSVHHGSLLSFHTGIHLYLFLSASKAHLDVRHGICFNRYPADTEYRIGWFPLHAYSCITGLLRIPHPLRYIPAYIEVSGSLNIFPDST